MAKVSMSDLVYEAILDRIIKCQYAPGSLLTEEQLVQELHASRTPIRAALIRLERDNLVRVLPKKGVRVIPITPDYVRDIFDIRESVELFALRNFGQNFKKDHLLKYLKEFAPVSENAELNGGYYTLDSQFHLELVSLAGNMFMDPFYRMLQHHLTRISTVCGKSLDGRLNTSNEEHRNIVRYLLRDDLPAAEEALLYHLKQGRYASFRCLLSASCFDE